MSIRRILSSNDYFFGLKTGILSDSWFSDTPYDFKETDKAVNTVNKLIKILSAEENCSGNSIFLLEKGTNRVIAGPYVIR